MDDQELIDGIARSYVDRVDDLYRTAILATDWNETDVLRIVVRHPGALAFDPAGSMEITPQYEIDRYADRAPPVSAHADGERMAEVVTVTWPLLERLAKTNDEIADLVRTAAQPSG